MIRQTLNLKNGDTVTAIKTVTALVSPVVTSKIRTVNQADYSHYINDVGFIVIRGTNLPEGEYEVFRNTQLSTAWTTDLFSVERSFRAFYQYLIDHRELRTAELLLSIFRKRLSFQLSDHHISLHESNENKPVRNPTYGLPSIVGESDLDVVLKEDYLLDLPVLNLVKDQFTGISLLNDSYTFLKEIALVSDQLTLILYKNMYHPKYEGFKNAIKRLTSPIISAKIYFNDSYVEADNIEETAGLITLKATTINNLTGLLAVELNDVFIPLKLYFNDKRSTG